MGSRPPRLRILVVSNLFPPAAAGGYEHECEEVVRFLSGAHDVCVLTSTRARGAAGQVVTTLPFAGEGIAARLLAPVHALRGARAARRLLARFRPDVVWIWNGAGLPHAALRVAEEHGAPTLWRVCEHWFGRLYRSDPFTRHLLPGGRTALAPLRLAAALVNLHPWLRLDLRRRIPAAISWNSDALRRLTSLPPSVEPRLERTIHPATSQAESLAGIVRAPGARPLLVFLGRVEPQKGPQVLLDALAVLRRTHGIDAQVAFAGDVSTAMRGSLTRQAKTLGVDTAIELHGHLERDDLAALLARAHAVVIPAVWEEPFGLVAVEAALAGVPVVAARSGGLVEILREPEEALFFDRRDAEGCAAAVHELLADPAATARRVEAARRRAATFSLERYLAETRRFLGDALTRLS